MKKLGCRQHNGSHVQFLIRRGRGNASASPAEISINGFRGSLDTGGQKVQAAGISEFMKLKPQTLQLQKIHWCSDGRVPHSASRGMAQ